MTPSSTHRPVRRVPAPRLRDADGSISQAPCRSAGHAAIHPVQPLKGLPGTRATDVSYRALAPVGAGTGRRVCTGTSESRPTAHYSLLTANSSYTFSAKEKDVETGLSYFGSRYYSSDLSVWLSVDPMSDKYPSLSPYTYCADNPVKLVDPNGEELTDFYDIVTGEHIEHIEDGIDEAIAVHRSVYDAYVEEGTLEENKDKIGYSLGKNSDFVDLAGTIYAESDAWNYSLEESAGIGSVLRNRAIANNSSLVAEASSGNVFGWGNRESIMSPKANPKKVRIAYRAAMLTIEGGCDFSKGGYYWQGRDFAKPGSGANNRFYQTGFHFRSPRHDIFGMGDKISNDSWKYKYESTAAAGGTVFMRLTEAWKNANHTKKWNGGR